MRRAAIVLLALSLAGCAGWRSARLYGQGSDALDQGDARTAIEHFERALALTPDVSELYNNLGVAYSEEGRHDDALSAFRRAVALDCRNDAAKGNLRAAETHHALEASVAR